MARGELPVCAIPLGIRGISDGFAMGKLQMCVFVLSLTMFPAAPRLGGQQMNGCVCLTPLQTVELEAPAYTAGIMLSPGFGLFVFVLVW